MFVNNVGGGKSMPSLVDDVGGVLTFNAQKASASYGRDNTTEVRPKNISLLYCKKV